MSEDSYRGDRKDPLSLNLYTYCKNEPIMYVDLDGHAPQRYAKGAHDGDDKKNKKNSSKSAKPNTTSKSGSSTKPNNSGNKKDTKKKPAEVNKKKATNEVNVTTKGAISTNSNGNKKSTTKVKGKVIDKKEPIFKGDYKISKSNKNIVPYKEQGISFDYQGNAISVTATIIEHARVIKPFANSAIKTSLSELGVLSRGFTAFGIVTTAWSIQENNQKYKNRPAEAVAMNIVDVATFAGSMAATAAIVAAGLVIAILGYGVKKLVERHFEK